MKRILFALLVFMTSEAISQDLDSLMQSMEGDTEKYPVSAIFKSPKLVLLQTNVTQKKQNLTFWIGHRFGDIGGESGGSHTLFGLDAATDIHIGFDYGITDDLTVGIGRSKYNETYNLKAKYALFDQYPGGTPLALSLFGQSSWITREEFVANEFPEETDRISHFLQLIAARKFSPAFSFMVSPGYLIRTRVTEPGDEKGFFVLGMGGRFKFAKRLSIIADYMLVNGFDRPGDLPTNYYNPLGVGLEIETGGHVFSLNFQNSSFITANNFIPNTRKSWEDGGVRFGFSISRNFYLGPKDRTASLDEQ